MRAGRLVALLLTLQQRRRTTAAELAAALEVSERTIYRDVAALQAAGVPLWAEPGPSGGFRLVEGWRTRLDGLTGQEAAALFLGGAPEALAELGLGTVLAAAQAKVLATLPPELRGWAVRIRERFHLDAPGWFHRPEDLPHLATVADAVWQQRRLDVRYRRGGGEVTRLLEPLGLVLKAGVWYVVAGAVQPDGSAVRTFRVSRISAAAARDERFTRPENFDLAAWWARASTEFDRSILRDRVRLRLGPLGLRLLPHLTGTAAALEAIAAAGRPDTAGWRELELAVESEEVALSQLTGLGAEVEVLAPVTLRAALAAVGAAMAHRNAPVPSGDV
ncbi:helix-turn-helix transcriptional regulator [Gandjariella thermophila]|uniref:helix-turn-helix transcriptional regulator n=1 Tax=Gandjariella thermophila TaxID=1931992 RepID=UPI0010F6BA1C|nr:WYL domain-containing protein [Gandjariella thermophila]